MRFKHLLPVIVVLLAALHTLKLAVERDLDLYIHPRYISASIGLAVVGLALAIYTIISARDSTYRPGYSDIPVVAFLALGLALPARSLTSATVSRRANSQQAAIVQIGEVPVSSSQLFAGSSKNLSLADWSNLLATNKDETFYANKPAAISGFVYDAGFGDDYVMIARFVVTCCAVDAQPVGAPVYIPDWQTKYKQDSWVSAKGTFVEAAGIDLPTLALMPTELNAIAEPEDPYAN